jgi:hypothetical protein
LAGTLDALRQTPSGNVVDGELVLFHEGRPNLHGLLQRINRSILAGFAKQDIRLSSLRIRAQLSDSGGMVGEQQRLDEPASQSRIAHAIDF